MIHTNTRRRPGRAVALLLAGALATITGPLTVQAGATPSASASVAAPTVSVFPQPGSTEASPTTTISFRGVAPAAIGAITVTGSSSGAHSGTWVVHSDGRGASFQPRAGFVPGERVAVSSHLRVRGADGDTFSFTVARPSTVKTVENPTDDFMSPPPAASATAGAAVPDSQVFRSRPDLHPPNITVKTEKGGEVPGYLAVTLRGAAHSGPMLIDNHGQVVWINPLTLNGFVADAKVVHYKGKDDLAWWHGEFIVGFGEGRYDLVDDKYQPVATIRAGNGYSVDLHELQITPDDTALIGIYNPVSMDLTPYGGTADGSVLEFVVQEIDVETGAVLFEWHSLDDIPVTKSVQPAPHDNKTAWDYLHGNAIELDTDGKLLVSARHTSAIYKIDRTSGHVVWTLGKGGDFTPSYPASEWFANQHDIRRWPDNSLTVFDNGSGAGPDTRQFSRALVLSVNEISHTVAIVRSRRAPVDVKASSQGSFRRLSGNHDLIGWGQFGEVTEYNASGVPILDLIMPATYRAVRSEWHGHPTTSPALAVTRAGSTVSAYASWNGATEVTSWVLKAGADLAHLSTVATAARSGFETTISGQTNGRTVVVEARDVHSTVLGQASSVYTGNSGYWLARNDGAVRAFGAAVPYGNATVTTFRPVVGIARGANGGYWVAQSDGSVHAVGTTARGSLAGRRLSAPIVGIAATPDGNGYWLVGADGGVFTFGTAPFLGSLGNKHLNARIVGIAATADGKGYRLVAADGGVFTFGTAKFKGSLGNKHLNARIVGIAATLDGNGYWLVGADGGVFTFGTAPFKGSLGGAAHHAPVVGFSPSGDGGGYWLVDELGGVANFGSAVNRGSAPASFTPVVAIAGT